MNAPIRGALLAAALLLCRTPTARCSPLWVSASRQAPLQATVSAGALVWLGVRQAPEPLKVMRSVRLDRSGVGDLHWVPGGGFLAWWALGPDGALWTASVVADGTEEHLRLFRVPASQLPTLAITEDAPEPSADQIKLAIQDEIDHTMRPFYADPPDGGESRWKHFGRRGALNPLGGLAFVDTNSLGGFVLQKGELVVWARDATPNAERVGDPASPGPWLPRDRLRWTNEQPFRILRSMTRWWFLTDDGSLWFAHRAGEPNRQVVRAWSADAQPIRATIADYDLNRSYVFGDGWYLDLGDELKEVKEPVDKPWPRPNEKASEIDKLLVYRGWVDLADKAKQP